MKRRLRLLVGALLCLLGVSAAWADAIVITQAMKASTIVEIYVEESSIRVEAEIGGRDLPVFRNLMPDSVFERMGNAPEPLSDRLPRFFAEDLVIRPEGGEPLPARVLELEPRPKVKRDLITGEPLPPEEGETETVVFGVFEYFFDRRPDTLTITTPRSEIGAAGASIGFVLYHLGLPVTDFRYLGTEATVDLDWGDPWYSRFRSRNLRRQYDAPMNAFLYVEPFEVRAEVIVRPVDIEQWIDLGLAGVRTIEVDAQYDLKQRIAAFIGEHLNLAVDGSPVEPELDRVSFLKRTLRTSTVIDPPEPLDAISATLGVIFVWPTEGLPQEASITWDLFSPRIQKVPAAATDEAGPLRFFLAPDDNVLWWKNFLKNPTVPTLVDVEPPPEPRLSGSMVAGLDCRRRAFLVVGALQMRGARKGTSSRKGRWATGRRAAGCRRALSGGRLAGEDE